MEIKASSWHAKFFKILEGDDPEPSVCKYWSNVFIFMPIFYILFGPLWLVGGGIIWIFELIAKMLDKFHLPRTGLRLPHCPWGKIDFKD